MTNKKDKQKTFRLLLNSGSFIITFLIYLKGYNLYFPFYNPGATVSLITAFSLSVLIHLLCAANPFLKNTDNGIIASSLLTAETPLFLLFFQKHFLISVLTLSGVLLLSLYLYKEALKTNRGSGTKSLQSRCRRRVCALSVYILSAVLILPSAYGFYEEYIKTDAYYENLGVSAYADGTENTYAFGDVSIFISIWDYLSSDEKETTLRTLVLMEKNELGIDESHDISLKTEKMAEETCGSYDHIIQQISINEEYLENGDVRDIIETLLHEMHHAYVYYTIDNLEFKSEFVKNNAYFSRARDWKNNTVNYISADEDYEKYRSQPIEADAESYAKSRANFYFRN